MSTSGRMQVLLTTPTFPGGNVHCVCDVIKVEVSSSLLLWLLVLLVTFELVIVVPYTEKNDIFCVQRLRIV